MIVYNHMQAWIYALPDLSGNAKLLLQRMVSLSKDGEQPVFVKREDFARQLGFAAKTVSRAFIELTAKDFIEEIKNPNKWDRVKHFRITSKTLQDFSENTDLTDLDKMSTSKETKCPDRYGQNDQIDMDKKSKGSGQNVPLDLDKMSTSSLDRSFIDRSIVGSSGVSTTIPARENTAPRYYDDIPDPDYDEMFASEPDTYEADQGTITAPKIAQNAQEGINAPRTINYQSTPNTAPPTQYTSEIEGYSNTSPYNIPSRTFVPQSPEEVIPLIERFKASRKNERVFEKIDVRYYAWKIFDNYFRPFENSQGGEWVDRNNYVVPPFKIFGKISSWITKDQQAGKLALIQPDLEANKRYLEKICEMTDPARFKKQQTAVEAEFEVIDEQDKTQSTGTALRWPPSKPKTPEEEQKELERIKEVVKWM